MAKEIIDSVEKLEEELARVREAQRKFSTYTQEQVDKIFLAAAKAANSITKTTPSIPESSPIYFIIDSLDTHSSISPSKTIIGGRTENIWNKLSLAIVNALIPVWFLKIKTKIRIIKVIRKNLYLFKTNITFCIILKSPP